MENPVDVGSAEADADVAFAGDDVREDEAEFSSCLLRSPSWVRNTVGGYLPGFEPNLTVIVS